MKEIIDLDSQLEKFVGFESLEDALSALPHLSEIDLQKLQTRIVEKLSTAEETIPSWARALLDQVQRSLLLSKMKKITAKKPTVSAKPAALNVLNAEISRGGAAKTLVILKKLSGDFPESLLAQPRIDFAIKAPLNQIAAKKTACTFSIHAGETGEGLNLHVDYFKSRQRAGLAKIGDMEIALIPPGPLSRTLIGSELLTQDPTLSQLPLGLVLTKYF